MRFIGSQEARLDMKGRVFLPATFRKQLQAHAEEWLILRKDIYQPCLVLYTESVWNEQLLALRAHLNRWDPSHQAVFRQFVSDVEPVTLDSNGRFILSKRSQALAGIKSDVRFIGMDDTIELWAAEKAEAPFVEPKRFGEMLQEVMCHEVNHKFGDE